MIILQRTDIEETTLSSEISDTRLDLVAQLVERWTSKPKVAGSIPTVVRQIFTLSSVDTQSGTHTVMFYTSNKNI